MTTNGPKGPQGGQDETAAVVPIFQKRDSGNGGLDPAALRVAEQLKRSIISPRLLVGIYRASEFCILFAVGMTLYFLYVGHSWPFFVRYFFSSLVAAASATFLISVFGGYNLLNLRSRLRQTGALTGGMVGAVGALALVLFFARLQDDYSRIWLAAWFAIGFSVLFVCRVILGARLRHWARNGFMERRAVLVGGGTAAEKLIRALEAQRDSDIRICGIFDDRDDARSPPLVAGYPKLGSVRQLVQFARIARIDMLIVTLPLSAEQRIQKMLKDLWVLPLDIRLSTQSSDLAFRPRTYSYVGTVPFIDVVDKPLAEWDWIAKRGFDVLIAILALVALSPLMIATAIAIKLDSPGPIFFRQKRHGFNNQEIDVIKFRSLHHAMADPTASRIVTKGDKRVTRVGKFIRRTSIDELPQLINVVRGELSLVGPRPHAVYAKSSMNEAFVEIVDGYFGRHKVKPGITGWAQVNGWRGEIDDPAKLKKRFEYDLHYIENWSIFLDLYILAITPISLFKREGAY
ncbi:undecaprenyl-phosphate glucose phosphotransferase [Aureimonas mangrovi]|uniref:undecaprenyl-phosphate glucose phosphotransferase n=1 Tax=Aureimonas mangrovi TaxID=2758041 RepID=UPI001FE46AAF|nr:undecaprenyl-phosphate glucose phosphotransferase [Aureimonas mangrovi]